MLKLAPQVEFRYAANIEYEMEEKDPTEGVRRSFEYVKRALTTTISSSEWGADDRSS